MTAVLRIAVKNDTAAGLSDVRRDVEAGLQSVARLDDALPTTSVSTLRDEIRNLASETQRGFAESTGQAAEFGRAMPFDAIRRTSAEMSGLGRELQKVEQQERQQIVVIAQLKEGLMDWTADFISDAKVIGGVLRDTGSATIDLLAKLKQLEETNRAVAIATGLAEGAVIRTTAALAGYGAQAGVGLTTLAAARVGILAYEAAWARTGKTIVQSVEASERQKMALVRLRSDAEAAGVSVVAYAKTTGQSLDDLSAKIETNYDRIMVARQKLSESAGSLITREASILAKDLAVLTGLKSAADVASAAWKEADAAATRGASNLIENLNSLRSLTEGLGDSLNGAGSTQRGKDNRSLEDARKREIDDFERLRAVNASLQTAATARAEATRLAGLTTTAMVDAEITKQKERAGILASIDKFDEAAQAKHLERLTELDQKRRQIDKAREEASRDDLTLMRELQAESKRRQADDLAGLDALIRKEKQRADELRQRNEFDKAAQNQHSQVVVELEQRRTNAIHAETEKRKSLEWEYAKTQQAARHQAERDEMAHYDRRLKLAQDYYASAEKLQASERSLGRELQSDIRQSAQQTRLDRLQAANASQAELQQAAFRARAEQLQATGASEAQIGAVRAQALQAKLAAEKQAAESEANLRKQTLQAEIAADQEAIDAELDARKKSAKTAEELQRAEAEHAEKALKHTYDSARKWLKLETELQREEMQRQVQARQAKAQMEESVERDKLRRLSQLREMATNAINKGGAQERLQEMRQQLSQRDVARQVGNRRADAAEQDWLKNGSQKFIEDRVAKGAERADAERQAAVRQKQIRNQAFAGGFGDTMRGRTNEQETLNAQNELIKANVQAATATGQLAPIVAQGLQMAAQQAIQASQEALVSRQIAEAAIAALQANGQKTGAQRRGLTR
jgi:hypothetical protein